MELDARSVDGGVCAPRGFKAAGVSCGLKESGEPDLCILAADASCAAAGAFTTNAFQAAPVRLTRERLSGGGFVRAVVVNSGNANAWTGARGMDDARATAEVAAREIGADPREVVVASTGVIGKYLDMEKVKRGVREAAARLDRRGASEACRAIMTTDTFPKQSARECGGFTVGGMAKGAGMIKPDMATMLCFITTDAEADPAFLHRALRHAVDRTFNRITIDGCTSTNDMVLAMAGGESGSRPSEEELREALFLVCSDLARAIVQDGEGATKFVRVRLHEAADEAEAKRAAMMVAESALVKTALFGGDPNWGRVVQALGQAVRDADAAGVRIQIAGITVAGGGEPRKADLRSLEAAMAEREIALDLFLGRGEAGIEVWTCDYSHDYVRINSQYHT